MKNPLHGLGVALVTPFDKNLQVDWKSLEKLLALTAAGGVNYWVIHGSTGEAATTNDIEKKEILTFLQSHNTKQLPIVYGLGGNNTEAMLEQIKQLDLTGVDAIMSVSPFYNKPSQKGIYEHYKYLAAASPVPLILYNVPSRTGSTLAPETVIKLSVIENIIGIKEASGNLLACIDIIKNTPPDFLVIAGDDLMTIPIMAIGGVGVISVLANVLPQPMHHIIQAMYQQAHKTAQQHQFRITELQKLILEGGNPVVIKHMLAILNICERYVRLPLVPDLDENLLQQLQKKMQPWGIAAETSSLELKH